MQSHANDKQIARIGACEFAESKQREINNELLVVPYHGIDYRLSQGFRDSVVLCASRNTARELRGRERGSTNAKN